MRDRPFLPCLHIHEMADELAAIRPSGIGPRIPHHGRFGARHPLQHAALLPIPRVRLAEFDPLVAVLQIDHADLDHIVRRRRAVLEINLVAEHEAPARIELILVVISEPMKLRPARDRADGRKFFLALRAERRREGSGGEGAKKGATGKHDVALDNRSARQIPVAFSIEKSAAAWSASCTFLV